MKLPPNGGAFFGAKVLRKYYGFNGSPLAQNVEPILSQDVPPSVLAVLDAKWAEVIQPATGFACYTELRAAVRALG